MKELLDVPNNTVVIVMSNNETDATRAYKLLKAQGVMNLYILNGGINHWLKLFPLETGIAQQAAPGQQAGASAQGEGLNYTFTQAVGSTQKSANPGNEHGLVERGITFTRKVKIQKKKVIAGGCG